MKTESVIVVGVLVIGGLVLLGRREDRPPATPTNGVIPTPKLIEPREPTTLPAINIDIATKVEQRARPQPVKQPIGGIPTFPAQRTTPIRERHRGLRPRPTISPRPRAGGGARLEHGTILYH